MNLKTVDLGYRPHRYQLTAHDAMSRYRFGVWVCHRRWGKTVASVMSTLVGAMHCRLPNARFAYAAPRLKQAKQVAWLYLCQYALKIPGATKHEADLYVELPNGARVTLYGVSDGNEEAMRGLYLDGIVFDEYAQAPRHVWPEIVRPALSDRQGWALFIGTPHGVDAFQELYSWAQTQGDWYTALYRADETDLPWLPPSELEAARRAMGEAAYRQEYLCDFSASAFDAMLTIDEVSAAAKRHYTQDSYDFAPKVLGVDVARFGDDRSVIQRRQGLRAWEPLVFDQIDNMTLANRVAHEINEWRPDAVFIDAGRGEGVIDRLRQLKHNVVEVNFGSSPEDAYHADKRTEMWARVRDWVREGGAIPNQPNLKTDLCAPTFSFLSNGKIRLEKKEDVKERIGRSTDLGDALALTFAYPVSRQPLHGEHAAAQQFASPRNYVPRL
jgi:hypothetical protein